MTDGPDDNGLPEDLLIAAEYALGVLSAAEHITVRQRIARDTAFAELVTAWEERLAPWTNEVEGVTPPPRVWGRIAGTLPPSSQRNRLSQGSRFWRRWAPSPRFPLR
jgi:anti-sigma-K factor RskA